MNQFRQPPIPGQRLNELLDAIRHEFELASQDHSRHREEYEVKLYQQQVAEMQQMQHTFYELERAHAKMKAIYEEEISKLRRELESRGIQVAPSVIVPAFQPSQAQRRLSVTKSAGTLIFGDVDVESIPPSHRQEGPEWHALFNPKAPRTIGVTMKHNYTHQSVVCCVRFSSNGKLLATGSNHLTHVFDVTAQSDMPMVTLRDAEAESKGKDLYIRTVSFSGDGTLLATGAEDRQVRIWELKSNKLLKRLKGHTQDIYSLEFFKDAQRIVSGGGDATLRIWEVQSGECKRTITIEPSQAGSECGVTSVAISPSQQYVTAASLDKLIRIWNVQEGNMVAQLIGHSDSVYSVSYHPEGKQLVSGALDKTLKLWDISSINDKELTKPSCTSTFTGHRDFVLSVAFSPDGQFVVSGSKDRTVQLWDPRTGQSLMLLQGHKNSVINVALSQVGNLIATGSGDQRARCWALEPVRTTTAS